VTIGYPHFSPLARIIPLFSPLIFGRAAARFGLKEIAQIDGLRVQVRRHGVYHGIGSCSNGNNGMVNFCR
jgi:hypothetical protein